MSMNNFQINLMRKKNLALNNEVHYNGHDDIKTSLSGSIVNETVI